jgi:hypothetical protein
LSKDQRLEMITRLLLRFPRLQQVLSLPRINAVMGGFVSDITPLEG